MVILVVQMEKCIYIDTLINLSLYLVIPSIG